MSTTMLPTPTRTEPSPTIGASGWDELRNLAELFADHQHFRVAQENRIRSSPAPTPAMTAYADSLLEQEKILSKSLVRHYRDTVPDGVQEWASNTPGVGEHLLARLLGHLGHPRVAVPKYWVDLRDEHGDADAPKRGLEVGVPFERSVGQLWRYCGHGDASNRRRAGMTQAEAFLIGNPKCKMLTHLIAEGVMKAQVRSKDRPAPEAIGALGDYFLAEKAKYRGRVHSAPCSGGFGNAGGRVVRIRCKVADGEGKRYAEAGDPFQPSHVQAIALRHLGKQVLRELYEAAA